MGATTFLRVVIIFFVMAAALLASLWVLDAISFEALTDKLAKLAGVGVIVVGASVVISLVGGSPPQRPPLDDPETPREG